MSQEVQVILYHSSDDEQAVLDAYHESSARMAGTTGLLGNHLLRSVGDPASYTVVSRWASWQVFEEWERSEGHLDQTAPLRPFRDHSRAKPFEVCRVVAAYGAQPEL
ncbi:antibiotic biosynthesis monooxygenase [Lentzea tibetensis]|uniref:Antibiotic biosynthesis monooxygenase n=1 Tax=Lentzea tibetensis TaxID=2591470 RepID=A0A563ES92_9PSEU|nr:antibiotic biosynthesis monooxygenase [Lentzea tibetensis]TWP50391.1 antibiotic biosynthesis monooxygenase [Lentzea tibetensis]